MVCAPSLSIPRSAARRAPTPPRCFKRARSRTATPRQRLRAFGARAGSLGENLAWAVGAGTDAASFVQQWLASPPHRANLLSPTFVRIGIGASTGTLPATQARRSSPPTSPVANHQVRRENTGRLVRRLSVAGP